MKYNTRIAPSPTGDMHLGTARTAYYNWLAARASGGHFTLRIDDTDAARNNPAAVQVILDTMQWLGLDYDYCFKQSNRQTLYRLMCDEGLTRKGWTRQDGGKTLLSLRSDFDYPKKWVDEVVGEVPITAHDMQHLDGLCLIRESGDATYQFASVCDDILADINYVIRGSDHITNTSKQVVLWAAIGCQLPKFAHIGLIAHGGKKLSKSDGAASMLYYKEKGYDPDAMLNFMARLGWGPKVDDKTTKMLPRERMLDLFLDGGNLKPSQANMDLDKLESFDRKYKAAKGIWRNRDKLIEPA